MQEPRWREGAKVRGEFSMAIIVESRNLPKKYQQQFTAETPLRRGPRRFFEAIIEVRRNLPKKYQQQFTAETRRAAEILFRAY